MVVSVIAVGCLAFIVHVETLDGYVWRNALPIVLFLLLSGVALYKGNGYWTASGWRWPLATLGYAIPAIGLSVYLHYGYLVDRDGIVSAAQHPDMLFAFLPLYTIIAGGIGFAIGWIVGRNV